VPARTTPTLLATSDLHVGHPDNREIAESLRPTTDEDWLIVAGDVAESVDKVESTLRMLAGRFAKVLWTPGNHELWSAKDDARYGRGVARYERLVELCRSLGVLTPEDPYPRWRTETETFVVAPLFLLYDYSFREPGQSLEDALAYAYEVGLVFNDEHLLHPDPYPSRQEWCRARVELTEKRLTEEVPDGLRTVLISHFPLHRGPAMMMRHKHLAMWCGTELTEDWHLRFNAAVAVYGHLHIPLTLEYDGVRFEEVSLGYPREWRGRAKPPAPLRHILPADPARVPYNRRGGA
jgi:3',5'-cyclic AMP phosphodiesterase CpdA